MEQITALFKALADRNRIRIVLALREAGSLCACQLSEFLGVSAPTVSRHLGILHRAGLISSRKDGRWVHYRLAEETPAARKGRPVITWLEGQANNSLAVKEELARLREILTFPREEICRRQRGELCCPKNEEPTGPGEQLMSSKPRILFLCTGNSCRSQMAEGWLRHLHGQRFEACSAGIEVHGLNPKAVQVMAEAGVDISGHSAKLVDGFRGEHFAAVITVCDHAEENCPFFPGADRVFHAGFSDPPRLAQELAEKGADIEEQLDCYRRVREAIRAFVANLPQTLQLNQRG